MDRSIRIMTISFALCIWVAGLSFADNQPRRPTPPGAKRKPAMAHVFQPCTSCDDIMVQIKMKRDQLNSFQEQDRDKTLRSNQARMEMAGRRSEERKALEEIHQDKLDQIQGEHQSVSEQSKDRETKVKAARVREIEDRQMMASQAQKRESKARETRSKMDRPSHPTSTGTFHKLKPETKSIEDSARKKVTLARDEELKRYHAAQKTFQQEAVKDHESAPATKEEAQERLRKKDVVAYEIKANKIVLRDELNKLQKELWECRKQCRDMAKRNRGGV